MLSIQRSIPNTQYPMSKSECGMAADGSEYVAATRRNEALCAFSAGVLYVQVLPHGVRAAHSDVAADPAADRSDLASVQYSMTND